VLTPEVAKRVKQTFQVGALTRNHVRLVNALVGWLDQGKVTAPR